MPAEEFCLRWNNHHPNLITVFSTLLQNDHLVDVTLISENREIHAHKIVLSACSPFFQNIFLRNSCKHPVIVLTGIKYVHIKSLIYFIYNGEVNIHEDHLAELLRVASTLKIKGLDEMQSNDTNELGENQDVEESNGTTQEGTLTSQTANIGDEVKQKDDPVACIAGTSDQVKTTKKRKSVTFSDTPEIVWGQLDASQVAQNNGNGKRKLRSLTDICSITKIKKENDEQNEFDNPDEEEGRSNENELFVSINPHSLTSLYTSNESTSADGQVMESLPKKQRIGATSRKMIRKNENFLRALQAVRDEGMGFCKAAKIHGVNNRTLWLEYQKRGYPIKNARKKSQS